MVLGVALPALGRAVTVLGITPPSRSSAHESRHLSDIAERPRGDEHRVLQRQSPELHPQVHHDDPPTTNPFTIRLRSRPGHLTDGPACGPRTITSLIISFGSLLQLVTDEAA